MEKGPEETIVNLLSRDVLKQNLAKAGLYALAYEMLKNSIIERPKGFFTLGGQKTAEYRTEVLSKHTNVLIASCRWLQENGAITEEEINEVLQFRDYRNYPSSAESVG